MPTVGMALLEAFRTKRRVTQVSRPLGASGPSWRGRCSSKVRKVDINLSFPCPVEESQGSLLQKDNDKNIFNMMAFNLVSSSSYLSRHYIIPIGNAGPQHLRYERS